VPPGSEGEIHWDEFGRRARIFDLRKLRCRIARDQATDIMSFDTLHKHHSSSITCLHYRNANPASPESGATHVNINIFQTRMPQTRDSADYWMRIGSCLSLVKVVDLGDSANELNVDEYCMQVHEAKFWW
jgi:hypothetical protein